MILFPHCKINLGIRVLRKRDDGFHDLESCFYPIPLHDVLEAIPADSGSSRFTFSGLEINSEINTNLVFRAWELLRADYDLPAIQVHLHKQIPMGAGLGGGSSDGSFMLRLVNELFGLELSAEKLHTCASALGSDCAFFLRNSACMAYGRGEILEPVSLSLAGWYIVILKPEVHVSTPEAFRGIEAVVPDNRLKDLLTMPVADWKGLINNDFEKTVCRKYPRIAQLKDELYRKGAVFASMSGSGSSVYGLFREKPCLKEHFRESFVFEDLLTV